MCRRQRKKTQAGFPRNYLTVDNILSLYASVEKQFVHKKKLYVTFIDCQKAYGNSKDQCYGRGCHVGIQGKLGTIIQSIYDSVKACIRGSNQSLYLFLNCLSRVQKYMGAIFCGFWQCVDVSPNGKHTQAHTHSRKGISRKSIKISKLPMKRKDRLCTRYSRLAVVGCRRWWCRKQRL